MQTRFWSLVESVANVLIGFGVALLAQVIIFPWFGIYVGPSEHVLIGVAFTVVSLVRSYVLRRVFNRLNAVVEFHR
jgi:NhaP-type Na+/H+ and K+/H+ antiporter